MSEIQAAFAYFTMGFLTVALIVVLFFRIGRNGKPRKKPPKEH